MSQYQFLPGKWEKATAIFVSVTLKFEASVCIWLFFAQVTILETGRTQWPAIGVVPTGYTGTVMPGWEKQSLGYHTDDGKIYHSRPQLRYDCFGYDTEGLSLYISFFFFFVFLLFLAHKTTDNLSKGQISLCSLFKMFSKN